MDRSLYINEAKGLEVVRDGPSLLVKEKGKANQRIPVRLIGRVFIMGNIKLESGVFTLLAENQIPVTLMGISGVNSAVCLPYNNHLPQHYEKQKVFLETEENASRFRAFCVLWRKRFQIDVIQYIANNNTLLKEGFKESDYRQLTSKYFTGYEKPIKFVIETITNLFRGLIIERLVKAKLDPHIGVVNRRRNFGFALDISYILCPEIDLQCIIFLEYRKSISGDIKRIQRYEAATGLKKNIVHIYEDRRKRVTEQIELIIDGLFDLMRELGA
ncbi:MAG: CRISPR-associated endonuclease Cas1 [Nitrospirae bacterium]|nr:CRISPR-associated endonuclease Cas1 [Nitrospirota bacterium]